MTTKVHLMTVLLIDHDKLGAEGTAQVLEDTRYPNDCLYPSVLSTQTQEVVWDDDHPLNGNAESIARAVAELFPRPAWTCHICGAPATCFGAYDNQPPAFACSTCCGHGNEDGRCMPTAAEEPEEDA
jgi:hypothetical protein